MTVMVERFDISLVPDHGRPEVVRFTGQAGVVQVHCDREDGSLWLFAKGPRGGERARVTVPVRLAGDVLGWLERADGEYMPSTGGRLKVKYVGTAPRVVVLGREGLSLPVGEEALGEFRTCLREWATAVNATERRTDGT
jgi:hypothetical protein